MQAETKPSLRKNLLTSTKQALSDAPLSNASHRLLSDSLLTDTDVSRLTGRARKTLQKDRLRGGDGCIPFIRLGRLVRYRQSDVAAYIAARPTLYSTSDDRRHGERRAAR
jgi:hypothetical protein